MRETLKNKFNKDIKKIFFVGIGGTSMSGLASIAKSQGFEVLGSDMKESSYTDKVKKLGIDVRIGHKKENIPDDTDLIVYSAAIHEDNPERMRGTELGIDQIERSKYLGLLSTKFQEIIGVAGTHGKTTTSAMVAQILTDAELDPSFSIGGTLEDIGGNYHLGNSDDYFVIESCEFRRSFLETQHEIGIITNIEEDHEDYYKGGLAEIIEAFHDFAAIIPETGTLIACGDDSDVLKACKDLSCSILYYGFDKSNNWIAEITAYNQETAYPSFNLYQKNGEDLELFDTYNLSIIGDHNVLNATAAIICAHIIGVDKEKIKSSIEGFHGAKRRFEKRGEVNGIRIFEDYAHHPTEIKVTLEAANQLNYNNLWIVFQPHTYSRTYMLFDKFVNAFDSADKVILNDIFSDRETNEKYDIFSEDIAKRIKQKDEDKFVIVLKEFENIIKFLKDNVVENDLILIAGSQTINELIPDLIEQLESK